MTSSPDWRGLFGSDLPIVQAPMAGAQDSALAAAVCNAGGVGSLPGALLSPDGLRVQLETLRAGTNRSYNVNFFCHVPPAPDSLREARWRKALAPYYRELDVPLDATSPAPTRAPFDHDAADILEAIRPPIVSFHFGLPSRDLLARVKAFGAIVWSSATTIDEARWLEAHGTDAIIAQGLEAGGHRGHFLSPDLTLQLGTAALLPQIVRAVRIPVIAAGGVADAAGVATAMALGAIGVQVGTAYLLCPESTTSAVHRASLEHGRERHTALTRLFSGRPARGIVNRLMRDLGPMSDLAPDFPLASAVLAPLRAKAESIGSGDFSPLWAGAHASRCVARSAADITHALAGQV